jgi:hypothetical protein
MEMSLAELIESSASYYEITVDVLSLYLTATSGYLIVAYLVGSKLTRSQMTIVSILFAVVASLSAYAATAWIMRASYFTNQVRAADPAIPASPNQFVWVVVGMVLFGGIIACLKFMWDVRHPKTE